MRNKLPKICEENITVATENEMNEEVKVCLLDIIEQGTRMQQDMLAFWDSTRKRMLTLKHEKLLREADFLLVSRITKRIHYHTKRSFAPLKQIADIANGVVKLENDPRVKQITRKHAEYLESKRLGQLAKETRLAEENKLAKETQSVEETQLAKETQSVEETKLAQIRADLERLEAELASVTKATAWNNRKQLLQSTQTNKDDECDFQSEDDDDEVKTEEDCESEHSDDVIPNARLQHDDDDLPPTKKSRQSKNN